MVLKWQFWCLVPNRKFKKYASFLFHASLVTKFYSHRRLNVADMSGMCEAVTN